MKVVNIVGARPQFIKVGPILRAIERHNRENPDRSIQEILVHTGQHYDYEMSSIFFEELRLKPDRHLGVGSGTHAHQTGEMLKRIEQVLLDEEPNVVLVYGDTNSTLAGALSAAKLHLLVAHVEAGLRSFNKRMPEEVNRVLTDHVSNLLFCPTETAVKNLEREGVTQGVHLVGDVMYDSVIYNVSLAEKQSPIFEGLQLRPKTYALATVHRAENTDDPDRLRSMIRALEHLAQEFMQVIVPLHPRTRKQLDVFELRVEKVRLIDPVSYLDMLLLEKEARVILTDSGGVQKEAYWLGVPCVTLREETEWVETVTTGWNILAGCDPHHILAAARRPEPNDSRPPYYGDGRAAERIVGCLAQALNG
ncbi:MAG: UDP-N-acetylglucosamine 2-epimerase (non-hydrolyzing) [Candidatus Tectomicrobia bacterium]